MRDDLDILHPPERRTLNPGAIFAVLIIVVGTLLLLHQNGVLDAWRILRYWPLVLVSAGLVKVTGGTAAGRRVGIILIVIGVLNFGSFLGPMMVLRFWPLLVIGLGVLLLWRVYRTRPAGEIELPSGTAELQEFALFGGGERKISAPDFEKGSAFAMFGGWDIDLRKAGMKTNRAVIDASCMFGGITLRVPEDWNVIMRGVGIFGGYSDSTRHPRIEEVPAARHLIVQGTAIFGGVDVKN